MLPGSSSVVLTRLSGPRSRPTIFFVVPGNRTPGSVARKSDHYTTEAVTSSLHSSKMSENMATTNTVKQTAMEYAMN
jgi:hypothetical protein